MGFVLSGVCISKRSYFSKKRNADVNLVSISDGWRVYEVFGVDQDVYDSLVPLKDQVSVSVSVSVYNGDRGAQLLVSYIGLA